MLVANNLCLTAEALATLQLGPTDLVVQFNLMLHFEILAAAPCQHLLVFRYGFGLSAHFGLPIRETCLSLYAAMQERRFLLFTDNRPSVPMFQGFPFDRMEHPLDADPDRASILRFTIDALIGEPYPTPAGINLPDVAGPSTGFWALAALWHATEKRISAHRGNLIIQSWPKRLAGFLRGQRAPQVSFCLLGFSQENDTYGSVFRDGSALDFERRWIDAHGIARLDQKNPKRIRRQQ